MMLPPPMPVMSVVQFPKAVPLPTPIFETPACERPTMSGTIRINAQPIRPLVDTKEIKIGDTKKCRYAYEMQDFAAEGIPAIEVIEAPPRPHAVGSYSLTRKPRR